MFKVVDALSEQHIDMKCGMMSDWGKWNCRQSRWNVDSINIPWAASVPNIVNDAEGENLTRFLFVNKKRK